MSLEEFVNIWDSKIDTNNIHIQSNEHVIFFSKEKVVDNSSLKLMHQFNLDFERQSIFLNGVKCQNRLSFFKCLTPYISKNEHFNQLLGICQQTLFAYIIKELIQLLPNNNCCIRDSNLPISINLVKNKNNRDISIDIKKRLLISDVNDGNVILNVLDINVISESLFDKNISVYVKSKYKI